ncbi:hypothetical protein TWF694_003777 [Orbilia ellipsospora]|uniref:Uncharacterized protein n=1 Tax=Orbilia ellipsospora TaxID=2528407 RepID=A0AAV9X573_9PEZI
MMEAIEHHLARRPDLIIDLYGGDSDSPTDRVLATLGSVVNASPVWARLLASDNGFAQLPTNIYSNRAIPILSLPNDDATAMLTLLNIIHYQHRSIPRSLTYEELLQVAIVCDKYDCENLAYPWAETWMNGLLDDPKYDYISPGYEGLFFIGAVFKYSSERFALVVEKLSARLIVEISDWPSRKSESFIRKPFNMLVDSEIVVVSTDMIPGPILEHMWHERASNFQKLLDITTPFYKDIGLSGDLTESSDYISLCPHITCSDVATGSIVRHLRHAGLPISTQSPFFETCLKNDALWLTCNKYRQIRCWSMVPNNKNGTVLHDSNNSVTPLGDKQRAMDLVVRLIKTPCTLDFKLPEWKIPSPGYVNEKTDWPFCFSELTSTSYLCGFAERMNRFHTDINSLLDSVAGYKLNGEA